MKKMNKKGFTLVELIVVIAIIGVLSAILIPTLVGYTLHSQVVAANTTAANLKKSIGMFLTEADGYGYGMRISTQAITTGEIQVVDGVWTLTIADTSLFNSKNYTWDGSGTCDHDFQILSTDSAEDLLVKKLAASLPEVMNAYGKFNLRSGICNALYFSTETTSDVTILAFDDDGWSDDHYEWDRHSEGVCVEGFIVGTAPVLVFG